MFKVLYAPFEAAAKQEIERYSSIANSALVWESKRRIYLFTASSAISSDRQAIINNRIEVACECLNVWTSQEMIKEMLRAIYYTNGVLMEA